MNDKFLVTYASRGGSTAGVAEAIGQTLTEQGLDVDLCPMQAVDDLTPYLGVIAGSAIHHGAWLPEAMTFLKTHQAALVHKTFATFMVCMTLALRNPKADQLVGDWFQPVRAIAHPVIEATFAGSLILDEVPKLTDRLKFRFSMMLGIWHEGDHRDWDAIHTWARDLVPLLKPVPIL
jgi:menaquinone-dependent protoporphyrinogen oxidase